MGALEAPSAHGVAVPKGLSMVDYDDIEIAKYLDLTTVRQPLFESGWRGTLLLLQIIEEGAPNSVWEDLPVEWVLRGTTVPPFCARRQPYAGQP